MCNFTVTFTAANNPSLPAAGYALSGYAQWSRGPGASVKCYITGTIKLSNGKTVTFSAPRTNSLAMVNIPIAKDVYIKKVTATGHADYYGTVSTVGIPITYSRTV